MTTTSAYLGKATNEHGSITRSDIDELLWNKLPKWMTDDQKKNRVKISLLNYELMEKYTM